MSMHNRRRQRWRALGTATLSAAALTAVVLASSPSVSSRGPAQGQADVEEWTFDRLDRLGAHPTTVLGDPRVVQTAIGPAVEFDGQDDALLVDVHPLEGATTFTWEAIFRPDGGARAQRWFHLQERGSQTRLLFEIRVTGDQWFLDSYAFTPTGEATLMNRQHLHPLGRWYHVAVVYDGTTLRNYVDGALEGERAVALAAQGPGQTAVGVRINLVDYFTGAVHWARFTRRALAPADFASVPAQTPTASRPNIVVVVADDHGQDTGAYGNAVVQTPHLDALAADGVRFRHAYATTASCSASRSVLLTGLHNHRTAQYGHEHDYSHFRSYDDLRPLPVLLREAGYRTARIGKFHVAPAETYAFDVELPGNQRHPVEMAERTREFVGARDPRPFLLYFATSDPHRGGGTVEGDPTQPDRFGNRPDGYAGIDTVTYDPATVVVPPWLPDTPATRAELAQYYQSVSRLDAGVGRLVQVLRDAGVYERTLLLYLSDHGAAFPGAKTTVYEPGLRSPLIVRHPDADRRGVVSDAMVSWVDLTPTLVEAAGASSPIYRQHIQSSEVREHAALPEAHGLHGRSFLALTRGEEQPGWDEVYASHTFHEIQMYYPMRVVRGRRYKLIWNLAHQLPFPFSTDLWRSGTWQAAWQHGPDARYGQRTVGQYLQRDEFELYDLERDPDEARNLATDPQHAGVLAEYQRKLRAFQERTSDPWVLKWTYQ